MLVTALTRTTWCQHRHTSKCTAEATCITTPWHDYTLHRMQWEFKELEKYMTALQSLQVQFQPSTHMEHGCRYDCLHRAISELKPHAGLVCCTALRAVTGFNQGLLLIPTC